MNKVTMCRSTLFKLKKKWEAKLTTNFLKFLCVIFIFRQNKSNKSLKEICRYVQKYSEQETFLFSKTWFKKISIFFLISAAFERRRRR